MSGYSSNNPYGGFSGGQGNSAAFGSIGSGIAGLFNNPYNAGNQYSSQIPGYLGQAFNPYMQNGQNLMGPLSQQFQNMAMNPGQNLSQIGAGYQSSPGYQFQVNQALQGANAANAANGMLGTNANQVGNMQIANQLANQNYNQYMGNALGVQSQGLSGMSGLENQGFNAASQYGTDMTSYLAAQAAQAQQAAQSQNNSIGGIIGGIGSMFGGGSGSGGSSVGFFSNLLDLM